MEGKGFKEIQESRLDDSFNDRAIELFYKQAEENRIYHHYIKSLGIDVNKIDTIEKIPCLPIEFFKYHIIKTGEWDTDYIFKSSGTLGIRSNHHIKNLQKYLANTVSIFNSFYGSLSDYVILGLLPSYSRQGQSSLVSMVNHFIRISDHELSGFYDNDYDNLKEIIPQKISGRKKILFGVSFALLDLGELISKYDPDLILIETGGMKGKREEVTRDELHHLLQSKYHVNQVHSEYGMAELQSQAYAIKNGIFNTPKTMKVLTRNVNDPFEILEEHKQGGINIIDLANEATCAFIETKDLGIKKSENTFEIVGRFDNSEIRGCNLMYE
ncbi:MAG TPA: acyl transferase [Cyclobacteriaceae bacterium]